MLRKACLACARSLSADPKGGAQRKRRPTLGHSANTLLGSGKHLCHREGWGCAIYEDHMTAQLLPYPSGYAHVRCGEDSLLASDGDDAFVASNHGRRKKVLGGRHAFRHGHVCFG